MAKTLTYTGALGPAAIAIGGIRFKKGEPVVVEEESLAAKIAAKPYITEDKPVAARPETKRQPATAKEG